jgi:hypothetical protein
MHYGSLKHFQLPGYTKYTEAPQPYAYLRHLLRRRHLECGGLRPRGLKLKFGFCRSQIEGTSPRTSARPMATVIDPSITKGQPGPRQLSPPPSHPPPSYNESTATQPLVHPGTSGVPHPCVGYGPTPIGQQQGTALPYYDPRSAHSVQAANRRAKERFAGAVLWVVIIFALLSVLAWMDARIQLGWLVYHCALLRAETHLGIPFLRLTFQHLLLVVLRCTYVDNKHVLY